MSRRTRRRTVVVLAAIAIAAVGSPARAGCQAPVPEAACPPGEPRAAGRGVIGRAVGALTTPADDKVPPVADAVGPVAGLVPDHAQEVLDRVNDLLRGPNVEPPGHVDRGPARTPSFRRDDPDTTSRAPGGGSVAQDPVLVEDPELVFTPPPTEISAASGVSPARPSFEGLGEALEGAAPSLALVLAFFLLAVAFIAIQVRLDRKDPRLALAPIESDEVEFA